MNWNDLSKRGLPACNAVVDFSGKHGLPETGTAQKLVTAINRSSKPPLALITDKCIWGSSHDAEDTRTESMDTWKQVIG